MERRKFEDSFRDAFEGAEVSPSEGLWTNIELDLEKADGTRVRRRLMFYKMLAAASVAFALCFAGISYYLTQDNTKQMPGEIAANAAGESGTVSGEPSSNPGQTDPGETVGSTSGQGVAAASIAEGDNKTRKPGPAIPTQEAGEFAYSKKTTIAAPSDDLIPGDIDESKTMIVVIETQNEMAPASEQYIHNPNTVERKLPLFYGPKEPELAFPSQEPDPDPGAILLAKLADEEKKYAEADAREKENKSEKLWTSVGFAAGGFSSVNASVSPTASNSFLTSSNSTVADKQASASGIAYSYGINVGTRISKRWVLQGGVNYLVQSSDYTATNVVGGSNFQSLKAESINALDNMSQSPQVSDPNAANLLAPTFPYTVNNNVKFFSVPVQAGYLVVNKKFGVQLNAGISTDLFLQNTITPESGSLDKTTQGRGEDSPYRSFNFSGLMGTEFTYRFGQHYRVALNPGLRYPFNSVYKTDVGVESTPLTFDVGLRFRYIFH